MIKMSKYLYNITSKNLITQILMMIKSDYSFKPNISNDHLNSPNLAAFGNTLLDFSARIDNDEILKKYGLGPNELGECSAEKLNQIIADAQNVCKNITAHPGGSAVNTCRILSALGESNILFFGCIGKDDNGRMITEKLFSSGVNTCFQINNDHATGLCICLILNENRCCFANISASIYFDTKFLNSHSNCLHKNAEQVVYIEGFFVTHRMSVCKYIYEEICKNNDKKTLAANLSATYIVHNNPLEIKFLAEHSDVLFGNLGEFKMLCNIYEKSSLIAVLNDIKAKKIGKRKIIVVTNGNEAIDVFVRDEQGIISCERYDVPHIPTKDLVDTTGAGDSFVAGFLYSFIRKKDISDSINCGIETAARKMKTIGGFLPL